MKTKKRLSNNPMPKYWSEICKEATHIWNVGFLGCKIRTKILLFKDSSKASKFMRRQFGYKWDNDCKGMFHDLSCTLITFKDGKEQHFHEHDPNYIGFICLLESDLRLEIIAHECCHAAFAYSERLAKKWPGIDTQPNEAICYPLGKLVAQVCSALQKEGYAIIGNHGTSH